MRLFSVLDRQGSPDACGARRGRRAGRALAALLGDPGYYRRFGFRLGAEYQISPPVDGWRPHCPGQRNHLLPAAGPGNVRYAEPFDRT